MSNVLDLNKPIRLRREGPQRAQELRRIRNLIRKADALRERRRQFEYGKPLRVVK